MHLGMYPTSSNNTIFSAVELPIILHSLPRPSQLIFTTVILLPYFQSWERSEGQAVSKWHRLNLNLGGLSLEPIYALNRNPWNQTQKHILHKDLLSFICEYNL